MVSHTGVLEEPDFKDVTGILRVRRMRLFICYNLTVTSGLYVPRK